MTYEKSCGIIPIQKIDNKLFVVLIKQNNGVVGFPKGHVEKDETEKETAYQECLEETNLKADIIDGFKEETSYYIPEYDVYKTVVYFIGIIDSSIIKRQESEVSDIKVVTIKEAYKLISFKETSDLLKKAIKFLKRKSDY